MSNLLKNLWLWATSFKRKRVECEKQKREGYSVAFAPGERGEWIEYREGDKFLGAAVTWANGCRLYTSDIREWKAPIKGQKLTSKEFELVVRRIKEYLLTQTSEVIVDSSPGIPLGEMMEQMGWQAQGEGDQITYVRKSPKD